MMSRQIWRLNSSNNSHSNYKSNGSSKGGDDNEFTNWQIESLFVVLYVAVVRVVDNVVVGVYAYVVVSCLIVAKHCCCCC